MRKILLSVTIATTIASSTLAAHSTTLGNVVDLHPVKIANLVALNPQPLPPRW
jgi:hypothetical protein